MADVVPVRDSCVGRGRGQRGIRMLSLEVPSAHLVGVGEAGPKCIAGRYPVDSNDIAALPERGTSSSQKRAEEALDMDVAVRVRHRHKAYAWPGGEDPRGPLIQESDVEPLGVQLPPSDSITAVGYGESHPE